ncbi:hypothetical protein GLAREA_02425 [Glarea lozoyensis ATCC 20868]|uniref:Uncharacterized protein n=1 Tax=Glarea lozoyensis (strain ATCC 20868 / MF5171) TaxID=1116229 RepID=S3CJ19_GLAL2|nr:uncharacterized protein GLAREA_02425 [Glarea lozoyensis ATCC 20868]EPE26512.1 hypothetical protein GLAREA_02425 [Glarea lozoyensis ATCC 20868]
MALDSDFHAALLAAAEVQEQCARANRRLAEEYAALHQRSADSQAALDEVITNKDSHAGP